MSIIGHYWNNWFLLGPIFWSSRNATHQGTSVSQGSSADLWGGGWFELVGCWLENHLPRNNWGFPKMVGFPNNHWVFLLKMISTWGVKWGYHHLRKHPTRPWKITRWWFFKDFFISPPPDFSRKWWNLTSICFKWLVKNHQLDWHATWKSRVWKGASFSKPFKFQVLLFIFSGVVTLSRCMFYWKWGFSSDRHVSFQLVINHRPLTG